VLLKAPDNGEQIARIAVDGKDHDVINRALKVLSREAAVGTLDEAALGVETLKHSSRGMEKILVRPEQQGME
jgi:hypothetical protein